MENNKYYYSNQIKEYFYEEYFKDFSKVKVSLENTELKNLLGLQKKNYITDIAKRLEIKGYSKLGKDGVVNLVGDKMIEEMPNILRELSYKELELLGSLSLNNTNEYIFNIEQLTLIESLCALGLIFKINNNDRFLVVVPNELKNPVISLLEDESYINELKERSLAINYIDGLLIQYGMIPAQEVYKLITDTSISFIKEEDYNFYCNYLFRSYEVFTEGGYLIHPYVFSPNDIWEELKVRQVIPYDYSNLDYFINLGKGYNLVFNEEVKTLRKILLQKNNNEDNVDSLLVELIFYIKNDMTTISIVELIHSRGIEFEKNDNELIQAIVGVYNTTPMWLLKGLTVNELKERRSTTIVKEKEPGRNEPCPCNSGKKYKKCCGK